MSVADMEHSLADLSTIATQFADLQLACSLFDMRADYYSVNQGYNELSTKFYDDAILFAKEHNLQVEQGIYMHRKAVYYFIFKHNTDALKYYLLAQDKFREVGYEKVPGISTYFIQFASFYYSIGDFENSRLYLNKALKNKLEYPRDLVNILNTIGLTYRNAGNYEPAMKYFQKALASARAIHDTVYAAIASGNIGSVYFLKGDYMRALPLVEADYKESLKYGQMVNSAIALLRLIKMNLESRNYSLVAQQLDMENQLLNNAQGDVMQHRVKYYELKALYSEQTGNVIEAVKFRKLYEQLKDSVAKRDNVAAVERIRLNWEMDKSRAEITKLKTDAEIENYKQNTVILILSLLVIISVLVYNRQRLKAKKDKELLASEKRRLDQELANANSVLTGYTENLMQKNILIEEFKSEVDRLQVLSNDTDGALIMDKMMQAHIMTDENWTEFKKLFTKAHPTFLYNVRNKFEHLTNTDVRLLALLKLRLNNREIASMLGITTDGVKKAKQRLRKKMEIPLELEMEDILSKL